MTHRDFPMSATEAERRHLHQFMERYGLVAPTSLDEFRREKQLARSLERPTDRFDGLGLPVGDPKLRTNKGER